MLALLWGAAMLGSLWWLSRDVWPEAYSFALGALVLVQLAAIELACFAIVFVAGFLVTWSPFLLGGAAGCLGIAGKHFRLAARSIAGVRGASQP